ncbi:hypothetical protein SEVIR_2G229133v4 [Setaria viridis]
MKTFDPWPVFFRREWSRSWPFLTGLAITGYLIAKMTANFTEEDLNQVRPGAQEALMRSGDSPFLYHAMEVVTRTCRSFF